MKIVVTGSHFTPAQAVIEQLQKNAAAEIVYIGRKYTREGDQTPSVESQVIPALGVRFIPVTSGRLQRKFTPYTIPSLLKIPFGLCQAFWILLWEQPAVVLSFGGYSSVPVVVAAWLLSIPVIIHEQTLAAGLADKIGALFADKIALSFADSKRSGSKFVLTGNPIRQGLLRRRNAGSRQYANFLKNSRSAGLPVVLVTAGNQGSHSINLAVEGGLTKLTEAAFVVHQTGDSKFADFERLEQAGPSLPHSERYLVRKWIEAEDFGFLLRHTDLAVARGGVNTLLELAFFEVPTLVIPLPFLPEQRLNAQFFTDMGLAKILHQSNLTPENLADTVGEMLSEGEALKQKAKMSGSLVIHDSARRLSQETLILAEKNV